LPSRWIFSGPNRWKPLGAKSGCKTNVPEISTVVLELSPGLLGLYPVWHCHDKVVFLMPVGLDVFCGLHPETSTELYSIVQNSNFHRVSGK
jgi:hypothetical protein